MNVYNLKQIPSEAQVRRYLRRIIFGKNVYCPECKQRKSVYAVQERYRCRKCALRFSLLSHTWLANMKLPLQQWWLLLWCWTTQVPVRQTEALSELSEKAVRLWFDQFRHHLPIEHELLEAFVQLDEAYFGGRKGFALVMGKQEGTRKLGWNLLPHTSPGKADAVAFLQTFVKPHTKLYTDGGSIYKHIDQWWPVEHEFDIHKKFEFTNTSEIEGMFGVLRTFIRRMYHHVGRDKFPEYMCEFSYRFSHPEMFKSPCYYLQNVSLLVPTG